MTTARAFLGAGDLYIARFVSGAFQEYEGPFECSKFEIKPNSEVKEAVSKGKSTYGQVVESVAVAKPHDLAISLSEINKTTLAYALMGTTATIAQAASTVTDEAVVAKLDKWVQLANINLAQAGVVITNSAASTTYVEGVDYLVNRTLGMFKAITGGAITDLQSLKADYSAQVVSGTEIKGASLASLRLRLKLDGVNLADGLPVITTVHEAVVAADAAFDFLGDNFAEASLPGRMKTPSGFLEPYTVAMRDQ
jgi:hypothetical protein